MTVASSRKFIGRGLEIAQLMAALEQAEQGRPQLVLLAGEAGVGKTRLLVEVAGRVEQRGVRVVTGNCVELGDIGLPSTSRAPGPACRTANPRHEGGHRPAAAPHPTSRSMPSWTLRQWEQLRNTGGSGGAWGSHE